MIRTRKTTLLLFVMLIMLSIAGISFISQKKAYASQEETPKYTVTINTKADSAWNVLVTRLPVSQGATEVTFKYKVLERTGNPLALGHGRGWFDNGLYNNAHMHAWWASEDKTPMLTVGATYTAKYYLDGEARHGIMEAIDANGNNILANIPGYTLTFTSGTVSNDHFGLVYISTASENVMSLTLEVQCYDNLGKDLQVTNGGCADIDGLISAPDIESSLTSGSMEDSLFIRSANNKINATANNENNRLSSFIPSFAQYKENDEELKAQGSDDGNALMFVFQTENTQFLYNIYNVEFGRKIKYADLPDTANLVIKAFLEGNDANVFLFSAEDENRNLAEGIMLSRASFTEIDKFTDIKISYSDMAKLADSNGYISGLTLLSSGNGSVLYIDEVFVSQPVNIDFYDEDGTTKLDSVTLRTGMSFVSQIGDDMPAFEKAGKLFVGWSTSSSEIIMFDQNIIVGSAFNLYAVYKSESSDYSSFAGMYYNAQSNKSFTLKADKTIDSIFSDVKYQSYIAYQDYDKIFITDSDGNKVIAVIENGNLLIDGVTYVKVTETVTVTYKSDGNTIATLTIPKGSKTIAKTAIKSDYKFAFWYVEGGAESAYDFNSEVNANLSLVAKFTFDEIEDYASVAGWYYCSANGKIIKLTTLKSVEITGSTPLSGTYSVSKNGTMIIVSGNISDISLSNNTISYNGDNYNKLGQSYTVTFDTDGGSTLQSINVSADTGYKLDLSTITSPVKEGYVFAGWKLSGESFDDEKMITSNITLVAEWTKESGCSCQSNVNEGLYIFFAVFIAAGIVLVCKKKSKV